jgi:hypothetical protein
MSILSFTRNQKLACVAQVRRDQPDGARDEHFLIGALCVLDDCECAQWQEIHRMIRLSCIAGIRRIKSSRMRTLAQDREHPDRKHLS